MAASTTAARSLSPRDAIARLRSGDVPTPLLGILLTLVTWSLQFAYPAPGIDASWRGGLYLAAEEGLDYGREIVFTYGPLGFLEEPINWDTTLASISFLFGAALAVLLACAVVPRRCWDRCAVCR